MTDGDAGARFGKRHGEDLLNARLRFDRLRQRDRAPVHLHVDGVVVGRIAARHVLRGNPEPVAAPRPPHTEVGLDAGLRHPAKEVVAARESVTNDPRADGRRHEHLDGAVGQPDALPLTGARDAIHLHLRHRRRCERERHDDHDEQAAHARHLTHSRARRIIAGWSAPTRSPLPSLPCTRARSSACPPRRSTGWPGMRAIRPPWRASSPSRDDPRHHPVIVHVPDAGHVSRWARETPASASALMRRFWPGPLTIVLPRTASVSDAVTGGQDTVALRVPAHPVALQVLQAFDGGLAAPSANRYGRISPTTAAHVRADLGNEVRIVLDGGPSDVGLESTIVACLDQRVAILRPGRIGAAEIEAVVGPRHRCIAGGATRAWQCRLALRATHPLEIVDATALDDAMAAHATIGTPRRSARSGRQVRTARRRVALRSIGCGRVRPRAVRPSATARRGRRRRHPRRPSAGRASVGRHSRSHQARGGSASLRPAAPPQPAACCLP